MSERRKLLLDSQQIWTKSLWHLQENKEHSGIHSLLDVVPPSSIHLLPNLPYLSSSSAPLTAMGSFVWAQLYNTYPQSGLQEIWNKGLYHSEEDSKKPSAKWFLNFFFPRHLFFWLWRWNHQRRNGSVSLKLITSSIFLPVKKTPTSADISMCSFQHVIIVFRIGLDWLGWILFVCWFVCFTNICSLLCPQL